MAGSTTQQEITFAAQALVTLLGKSDYSGAIQCLTQDREDIGENITSNKIDQVLLTQVPINQSTKISVLEFALQRGNAEFIDALIGKVGIKSTIKTRRAQNLRELSPTLMHSILLNATLSIEARLKVVTTLGYHPGAHDISLAIQHLAITKNEWPAVHTLLRSQYGQNSPSIGVAQFPKGEGLLHILTRTCQHISSTNRNTLIQLQEQHQQLQSQHAVLEQKLHELEVQLEATKSNPSASLTEEFQKYSTERDQCVASLSANAQEQEALSKSSSQAMIEDFRKEVLEPQLEMCKDDNARTNLLNQMQSTTNDSGLTAAEIALEDGMAFEHVAQIHNLTARIKHDPRRGTLEDQIIESIDPTMAGKWLEAMLRSGATEDLVNFGSLFLRSNENQLSSHTMMQAVENTQITQVKAQHSDSKIDTLTGALSAAHYKLHAHFVDEKGDNFLAHLARCPDPQKFCTYMSSMHAIWQDYPDQIQSLDENLHQKNRYGKSPIDYVHENVELMKLLKQNAAPYARDLVSITQQTSAQKQHSVNSQCQNVVSHIYSLDRQRRNAQDSTRASRDDPTAREESTYYSTVSAVKEDTPELMQEMLDTMRQGIEFADQHGDGAAVRKNINNALYALMQQAVEHNSSNMIRALNDALVKNGDAGIHRDPYKMLCSADGKPQAMQTLLDIHKETKQKLQQTTQQQESIAQSLSIKINKAQLDDTLEAHGDLFQKYQHSMQLNKQYQEHMKCIERCEQELVGNLNLAVSNTTPDVAHEITQIAINQYLSLKQHQDTQNSEFTDMQLELSSALITSAEMGLSSIARSIMQCDPGIAHEAINTIDDTIMQQSFCRTLGRSLASAGMSHQEINRSLRNNVTPEHLIEISEGSAIHRRQNSTHTIIRTSHDEQRATDCDFHYSTVRFPSGDELSTLDSDLRDALKVVQKGAVRDPASEVLEAKQVSKELKQLGLERLWTEMPGGARFMQVLFNVAPDRQTMNAILDVLDSKKNTTKTSIESGVDEPLKAKSAKLTTSSLIGGVALNGDPIKFSWLLRILADREKREKLENNIDARGNNPLQMSVLGRSSRCMQQYFSTLRNHYGTSQGRAYNDYANAVRSSVINVNNRGYNALMLAAESGETEVFHTLEEEMLNVLMRFGNMNFVDTIAQLLSQKNHNGKTLIDLASNNPEMQRAVFGLIKQTNAFCEQRNSKKRIDVFNICALDDNNRRTPSTALDVFVKQGNVSALEQLQGIDLKTLRAELSTAIIRTLASGNVVDKKVLEFARNHVYNDDPSSEWTTIQTALKNQITTARDEKNIDTLIHGCINYRTHINNDAVAINIGEYLIHALPEMTTKQQLTILEALIEDESLENFILGQGDLAGCYEKFNPSVQLHIAHRIGLFGGTKRVDLTREQEMKSTIYTHFAKILPELLHGNSFDKSNAEILELVTFPEDFRLSNFLNELPSSDVSAMHNLKRLAIANTTDIEHNLNALAVTDNQSLKQQIIEHINKTLQSGLVDTAHMNHRGASILSRIAQFSSQDDVPEILNNALNAARKFGHILTPQEALDIKNTKRNQLQLEELVPDQSMQYDIVHRLYIERNDHPLISIHHDDLNQRILRLHKFRNSENKISSTSEILIQAIKNRDLSLQQHLINSQIGYDQIEHAMMHFVTQHDTSSVDVMKSFVIARTCALNQHQYDRAINPNATFTGLDTSVRDAIYGKDCAILRYARTSGNADLIDMLTRPKALENALVAHNRKHCGRSWRKSQGRELSQLKIPDGAPYLMDKTLLDMYHDRSLLLKTGSDKTLQVTSLDKKIATHLKTRPQFTDHRAKRAATLYKIYHDLKPDTQDIIPDVTEQDKTHHKQRQKKATSLQKENIDLHKKKSHHESDILKKEKLLKIQDTSLETKIAKLRAKLIKFPENTQIGTQILNEIAIKEQYRAVLQNIITKHIELINTGKSDITETYASLPNDLRKIVEDLTKTDILLHQVSDTIRRNNTEIHNLQGQLYALDPEWRMEAAAAALTYGAQHGKPDAAFEKLKILKSKGYIDIPISTEMLSIAAQKCSCEYMSSLFKIAQQFNSQFEGVTHGQKKLGVPTGILLMQQGKTALAMQAAMHDVPYVRRAQTYSTQHNISPLVKIAQSKTPCDTTEIIKCTHAGFRTTTGLTDVIYPSNAGEECTDQLYGRTLFSKILNSQDGASSIKELLPAMHTPGRSDEMNFLEEVRDKIISINESSEKKALQQILIEIANGKAGFYLDSADARQKFETICVQSGIDVNRVRLITSSSEARSTEAREKMQHLLSSDASKDAIQSEIAMLKQRGINNQEIGQAIHDVFSTQLTSKIREIDKIKHNARTLAALMDDQLIQYHDFRGNGLLQRLLLTCLEAERPESPNPVSKESPSSNLAIFTSELCKSLRHDKCDSLIKSKNSKGFTFEEMLYLFDGQNIRETLQKNGNCATISHNRRIELFVNNFSHNPKLILESLQDPTDAGVYNRVKRYAADQNGRPVAFSAVDSAIQFAELLAIEPQKYQDIMREKNLSIESLVLAPMRFCMRNAVSVNAQDKSGNTTGDYVLRKYILDQNSSPIELQVAMQLLHNELLPKGAKVHPELLAHAQDMNIQIMHECKLKIHQLEQKRDSMPKEDRIEYERMQNIVALRSQFESGIQYAMIQNQQMCDQIYDIIRGTAQNPRSGKIRDALHGIQSLFSTDKAQTIDGKLPYSMDLGVHMSDGIPHLTSNQNGHFQSKDILDSLNSVSDRIILECHNDKTHYKCEAHRFVSQMGKEMYQYNVLQGSMHINVKGRKIHVNADGTIKLDNPRDMKYFQDNPRCLDEIIVGKSEGANLLQCLQQGKWPRDMHIMNEHKHQAAQLDKCKSAHALVQDAAAAAINGKHIGGTSCATETGRVPAANDTPSKLIPGH